MFTANQTFKTISVARKFLKRYLNCRRNCEFVACHPSHVKRWSLAAWVTQSPVSQRWEIHFRSNRLGVCDFLECETFNSFIDEKTKARLSKKAKKDLTTSEENRLAELTNNAKYWVDLVSTKKHVSEKRIAIMQQMVEQQLPLSKDAAHVGGDIDSLMKKIFG